MRDFFAASKRPADAAPLAASPVKKRAASVAVTAAAAAAETAPALLASVGGAHAPAAPVPAPQPPPPRDPAAARAVAAAATALVARRVAAAEANGLQPALADLLVEEGWRAALAPVLAPRAVAPLQRFLEGEWAGRAPVYPPKHLIFRAMNEVPLDAVRVVIIGQVREKTKERKNRTGRVERADT